jgi:peptidyl-prolyl cis-trans isomerase D
MLERMRQSSKSLIIWVLFGIIIAVFIISFGPQADQTAGCGGAGKTFAMEVGESSVSMHSWRFAVNGLGIGSGGVGAQAVQRRAMALDYLLERELLAQAAEERGLRVSDDVVNQAIAAGDFYVMGHRFDGGRVYYRDGAFDYDTFDRYAKSMGLPNVGTLINEQRREHLADLMRGTLLKSARVSEEEARSSFIQDNTKIQAESVVFDVARYERALVLGDAELAAYAARHADELSRAWEAETADWSTDKPRVLARHIFVARQPAAEAEPPAAAPDDPARATIEAARARIVGGADFAAVAREVSQDEETRAKGGRLGWRPADSLGYGLAVVEAVKALEAGAVSPVIEGTDGYHLIKLEARSDKALTFEDKKLDLAARLAGPYYARKLARRDAEAALARARTTPLEEIFKREEKSGQGLPPGLNPADFGLPEGTTIELPPGDEQGWVLREGDTRLAQTGGAGASPSPAVSPPTAGDDAEPLPTAKVEPPLLRTVGPVARSGEFVAGIGKSSELVEALFDELAVSTLADRLFEVETPDGFALVKLTERSDADMTRFDNEKGELMVVMAEQKSMHALLGWLEGRCQAAAKSGDVKVDRDVLSGDSDKPIAYQPCRNINFMSVLQQLETRQRR